MWNKKIIWSVFSLIFVMVLLCGCATKHVSKKVQPKATESTNYASLDFEQPKEKKKLLAEEIEKSKAEHVEVTLEEIFPKGKKGKKEIKEKLFTYIKNVIQNEELTVKQEKNSFQGEKGCYVSKVPLRYWDVVNNKMDTEGIDFIIFSKDFKKHAKLTCFIEDGKDPEFIWSYGVDFLDILIEHPKKKYIFFFDGSVEGMIDSNNQLTLSMTNEEISVEGDYFHALNAIMPSISYEKITAKNNLIWIGTEKK